MSHQGDSPFGHEVRTITALLKEEFSSNEAADARSRIRIQGYRVVRAWR